MFIAFYRWKLKPGKEEQFRAAWSEVTLAIRERCDSRGSRLHKAEDGTWAAYAQWPTRELWEKDCALGDKALAARQKMRDAVAESLPSLYMTVSDDYLVPKTP